MTADTAHVPEGTGGPRHDRRYFALPHTTLGGWSVALLALFWFFLALFYAFIAMDVGEGGDTIVTDWPLWATIVPAALCGVGAFILGWTSVFVRGERSLLVLLASAWGTFVTWFVSAELLFPH